MKIRTAYLDTCSIGELLLPKTAANRISMDRIIELAQKRLLTLFTSEECWIELNDSPKRYVSDLKKKYNSIPRVELKENIGVSSLIDAYTQPKVLDQPDATHLAYATFYKIDVLLTYNRRTIIKNSRKINRINRGLRYATPLLVTPNDLIRKIEIAGNTLSYTEG